MIVSCYYCKYKNFGDTLNKYIFRKIICQRVYWQPFYRAKIIGIGSIIDALFGEEIRDDESIIYCVSAGFANYEQIERLKHDGYLKLARKTIFIGVRGYLTKQALIESGIIHEEDNIILGDLGLLSPLLLEKNRKVEKKYKVGIVAHAGEKKLPLFNDLKNIIPSSTIIDIQQDVYSFLMKISQCETVISTALHPLIICDALGIPNRWFRVDDVDSKAWKFKFMDYYSNYNIVVEPMYYRDINESIYEEIINNYSISFEEVKKQQSNLLEELEILKKSLAEDKEINIKTVCCDYIYMVFVYFPKKLINKIYRMTIQKLM